MQGAAVTPAHRKSVYWQDRWKRSMEASGSRPRRDTNDWKECETLTVTVGVFKKGGK